MWEKRSPGSRNWDVHCSLLSQNFQIRHKSPVLERFHGTLDPNASHATLPVGPCHFLSASECFRTPPNHLYITLHLLFVRY